jgi:hypothetical protein
VLRSRARREGIIDIKIIGSRTLNVIPDDPCKSFSSAIANYHLPIIQPHFHCSILALNTHNRRNGLPSNIATGKQPPPTQLIHLNPRPACRRPNRRDPRRNNSPLPQTHPPCRSPPRPPRARNPQEAHLRLPTHLNLRLNNVPSNASPLPRRLSLPNPHGTSLRLRIARPNENVPRLSLA